MIFVENILARKYQLRKSQNQIKKNRRASKMMKI